MPASSSSTFHLSSQLNRRSSSSSSSSRGGEEWCSARETIMRPQEEYPTKKAVSNGSRKKKEKEKGVRYRECRKNHAANIGGYAVDGCREFMASGEEGTSAALRCAACSCHRNFHKREVENDAVCDCSSISTSRS